MGCTTETPPSKCFLFLSRILRYDTNFQQFSLKFLHRVWCFTILLCNPRGFLTLILLCLSHTMHTHIYIHSQFLKDTCSVHFLLKTAHTFCFELYLTCSPVLCYICSSHICTHIGNNTFPETNPFLPFSPSEKGPGSHLNEALWNNFMESWAVFS